MCFLYDMCREIALVLIMKGKTMDAFTSWLSENGLAIIGMLIAAVAVRGIVKFDVNQWLNDRRKRLEDNLRMLCPHVRTFVSGNTVEVHSTFISPPGTVAWQCQICGKTNYDGSAIGAQVQYWCANPNALSERNKEMEKLAKKLGR